MESAVAMVVVVVVVVGTRGRGCEMPVDACVDDGCTNACERHRNAHQTAWWTRRWPHCRAGNYAVVAKDWETEARKPRGRTLMYDLCACVWHALLSCCGDHVRVDH